MSLSDVYTGAHGTISVAPAGTDVQLADFDAISQAYPEVILSPIGRVTDVELCVHSELTEFYSLGRRDPQGIYSGNVSISGTIGRAYINGALLYLLLGRGASTTRVTTIPPRFVLNLIVQAPELPNNNLKISVFGVGFESWNFHMPQGDFVMEKVAFKAVSIGIIDTEESNEISVAFPEG